MVKPFALIVDDDPGLSDAFAMALERVGFDTEKLNDSTLALGRIEARRPDLVTLDMQMPVISGPEILRRIRADERIKSTKVILITANSRAGQNEELEALADVILIKPITLSQIKDLAARLVQTPAETETPATTTVAANYTETPTVQPLGTETPASPANEASSTEPLVVQPDTQPPVSVAPSTSSPQTPPVQSQ